MRLKQFIIEQVKLNKASFKSDFTISGLSDEEWAIWVTQHCSDYLPRASKYPIYRGFKNETVKLGVKDTNEFTRQSAGDVPNYYTLWMDNAPQWRAYPRRSRSFIGSSSFYSAQKYGSAYQLFPANDAKIGICPKNDIWNSFDEVPGNYLGNFAHLLKEAFKKIYGDAAAERAMNSWAELKRLLELTNFSEFLKVNKNYVLHGQFAGKTYLKLIDYFEEEIVPWKHGFQRATPANYSVTLIDNKEVWVQGKVALLDVYSIFNDNNQSFPKTTLLLAKCDIRKPY